MDNRIILEKWNKFIYESDTCIEKISENPDELYMLFLRNWSGKPYGQTIQGEVIEQRLFNPDPDDLNSVFLTKTDHTREAVNNGVLNIHTENDDFLKRKVLFEGIINKPIKRRRENSWSNILNEDKVLFNCNSMVFIDPWVVKNEQEYNEINLKEVLKLILPQSLSCDFHFTIVSEKDSRVEIWDDKNLEEIKRWTDNKKQLLSEMIREIRPKLSEHIIIEVYYNYDKAFHDRDIITNYTSITIGAGFDALYKDRRNLNTKAGKETKITILYPGFIFNTEAYEEIINQTNYCIRKQERPRSRNRLLS